MTAAAKMSDTVSRRGLLTGGLAAGFLVAFHLPARAVNEPNEPPDATDGKFAPNAFIRIDPAGKTTLIMPQVEMGQGVYTSIAMILAEELDADFSKVAVLHAPPNDKFYGNPVFGLQVTGNSNSIRAWWKPLRNAGASARAMLVQAAAAPMCGSAKPSNKPRARYDDGPADSNTAGRKQRNRTDAACFPEGRR
ncbi:MAG TPA: molybdopterin cofactor-binding domain-containing protein, partial [Bradyrhizobium sp.]|nr:molybdopterin cofactor-binding domain-containing protein [Bradyrhizobium sp.]